MNLVEIEAGLMSIVSEIARSPGRHAAPRRTHAASLGVTWGQPLPLGPAPLINRSMHAIIFHMLHLVHVYHAHAHTGSIIGRRPGARGHGSELSTIY
jgi:hypothetical protein